MIDHYESPFKYDENGDNREEVSTKFKVAKFGVFAFHAVAIIMYLLLRQWISAIWVLNSAIWAATYFNAKEG